MKYYVEVFRDEDNTKLLMMVEKQEISVPEEYYRFKNIWEALYVIDTERMAIKRVTDSYERKSLIHTGIRIIWADDFVREVEAGIKHERIWKPRGWGSLFPEWKYLSDRDIWRKRTSLGTGIL